MAWPTDWATLRRDDLIEKPASHTWQVLTTTGLRA